MENNVFEQRSIIQMTNTKSIFQMTNTKSTFTEDPQNTDSLVMLIYQSSDMIDMTTVWDTQIERKKKYL